MHFIFNFFCRTTTFSSNTCEKITVLFCSYLITNVIKLTLVLEMPLWMVSRDPVGTSVGAHLHPVDERKRLRAETSCKYKLISNQGSFEHNKKIHRRTCDQSTHAKSIFWNISYIHCYLFFNYWTLLYTHLIQVSRQFICYFP